MAIVATYNDQLADTSDNPILFQLEYADASPCGFNLRANQSDINGVSSDYFALVKSRRATPLTFSVNGSSTTNSLPTTAVFSGDASTPASVSRGMAAGIGVAAGLGSAVIAALATYLLLRRNNRNRAATNPPPPDFGRVGWDSKKDGSRDMSELHGTRIHELGGGETAHEVPGEREPATESTLTSGRRYSWEEGDVR